MAISATIYKIAVNIADMNRQVYQQHDLTVAQHPSETDFRLMTRIFAFALNADRNLEFTKGLSTGDEPELWLKSPSNEIDLWIDFGQVDPKRIGKACGRSRVVRIYTYDDRKSQVWWQQNNIALARYKNLEIHHLHADGAETFVERKMRLQCNIQDDELYVSNETDTLTVRIEKKTS